MKQILALLLLSTSCIPHEQSNTASQTIELDTLVAKIDMNDILSGSAYRKRATGYYLIINGDSSIYLPTLTESKEGKLSLMLGLQPKHTYQQQLDQLALILPYAAKEYNFDSLNGIYVGRLVQTGNLVIDITNEYLDTFGGYGSTATTEYNKIADFLAQSRLGQDINELLRPYALEVKSASVEKVFFTGYHPSVKLDSTRYKNQKLPKRLLDCMTWLTIGKMTQ